MGAAEQIQREVDQERQNGAIIFLPSVIQPESFYRPVLERIRLTDGDVYEQQGAFRIRYEGLIKLANGAGIEWSSADSGRTDNGSDKLYISFRAVGLIRKADGKLYPTAASYDLDLELIKEELEEKYKKPNQEWMVKRDWFQKRKHKATLAESGARARVIRSILGLQSQYKNKDDIVGRPFVMVRFVLDHQNPDIKHAMLSAARDNMSAIYGGGSLPQALPRFESAASDEDVVDIPPSHPDEPAPQQQPAPPFEPNPTQQDSRSLDFENSDIDTQVSTLEALAKQKNYNLANFLARGKMQSAAQMKPSKRYDLFNYLVNNL